MHEFSTAVAITENVLNSAKRARAKKILSIRLEIGGLTLLNAEQVKFWVMEGLKETIGAESKVKIENINPEILCKNCGYLGDLHFIDDPTYHLSLPLFTCPQCNSSKIEIKKGKGCVIRDIQILK